MHVLSLTHAHLHPDGLSPVSCERADSIVGAWADRLGWTVDVVHTTGTKWLGIWPEGHGLKVNIIHADAPEAVRMGAAETFGKAIKQNIRRGSIFNIASLIGKKAVEKAARGLIYEGLPLAQDIARAKAWGQWLCRLDELKRKHYDFIFVCVGHGDEYLLQTALTLSRLLLAPMIVDFRDLWSEHHVPGRFTAAQRRIIHQLEQKLLANTILISAPQRHMVQLLRKWAQGPVYLLTHSAYADKTWKDGTTVQDEFAMLYAGKLYPEGPGLRMLMELLKRLSGAQTYKPVRCHFFVDDTDILRQLAAAYGVTSYVSMEAWVPPSELWKHMRSAHLLVIPDAGVAADFPLLPTKTFQYVYTGRQVLSLSPHPNAEMQQFLDEHEAGKLFNDVAEAARWVAALSFFKEQYKHMPPLKSVPLRENIAAEYGREIEKLLASR